MKNKLFGILTALIMMFAAIPLAACNESDEIDDTKTQLYVYNFDGGFGHEWLDSAASRFAERYKDYSFEEGKKGVQFHFTNTKAGTGGMSNVVETSSEDIFFVEAAFMPELISRGLVLDITDIVTEDMSEFGESKSIESKMDGDQKSWFGYNDRYYGVPHYEAYWGITYNVDLFDEYGLYLAAEENNGNGGFIINDDDQRTLGPDGKTGMIDGVDYSADDGLPATYEEFYKLCGYMESEITPFIWTGKNITYPDYSILGSFTAEYEGYAKTKLNFTFDGEADIVSSVTNGVPDIVQEDISVNNGYLLFRQPGRYYSLSFLDTIIDNDWYSGDSYKGTTEHLVAQSTYIKSGIVNGSEKIAFLLDGNWWMNEATSAFNALCETYPAASKENRRFAWMPLPKATDKKVGEQHILVDKNNSAGFINANIAPSKTEAAKKFLQFCCTDESLKEFTLLTETPKGMKYTLTEDELSSLSYFGRSVWEYRSRSQVVRPFDDNEFFRSNVSNFIWGENFTATIDNQTYSYAAKSLRDNNFTAEEYFNGISAYFTQEMWERNYGRRFTAE